MTTLAVLSALALSVGIFGIEVGAAPAANSQPPIKPPLIHETFTLLPCNQNTTIGMEGCEERQLIVADNRVDREIAVLFTLLNDNSARRRLSEAESAWLIYRMADCRSQSDIYEGGTAAGIVYGGCLVSDDKARSGDLRGFYNGLVQGRDDSPTFP